MSEEMDYIYNPILGMGFGPSILREGSGFLGIVDYTTQLCGSYEKKHYQDPY